MFGLEGVGEGVVGEDGRGAGWDEIVWWLGGHGVGGIGETCCRVSAGGRGPSQDNMDGAGRAGLLAGGLGASDRSRASRGTRAIFLSSTIDPKVIDKLSCCS